MMWHELYTSDKQPTMVDMAGYVGKAGEIWLSLASYFESAYKAAPKITYSGCGMKPGWNVKYQKSGQAFGTWYPLEDAFDIMVIVSYKLDPEVTMLLPELGEYVAEKYREAGDYMKLGKWMMLRVDSEGTAEDYKKICAVKLAPKFI